jgi:DNA-binding transcriptional regulator YiaG
MNKTEQEVVSPAELAALGHVRRLVEDGAARELRLSARLGAAEIARVVGVSPQLVCDWEHGRRRPTGQAGVRYAQLLDQLASGQT